MCRWFVVIGCCWFWWALVTPPATSQEIPTAQHENDPTAPPAGHSFHGEAFNEGPRQNAYLIPGVSRSKFPVTTANETAQQFFNQGIDQLHGFWYFEAERSFRQVAAIDPECAMAYWGMALANINNEERARKFIATAVEKKSSASPREQLYIDGWNEFYASDNKKARAKALAESLEKIIYEFPDDIEAKSLLAVQLWRNNDDGVPIGSRAAVDALLDQVFAVEPLHPAHHYRIHLWDRNRAENALQSAASSGPALPGIAHMWHMPGHTYSELKRYADAAWQMEASARVDHAYMIRDRILPDQIHNFAHNNEWLIRNYMHIGRARDAVALAQNMISMPRHPQYNSLEKRGSSLYGRERLFQALRQFEMWDAAIAWCESPAAHEADDSKGEAQRLGLLGEAMFRSGNADRGREVLSQLQVQLAARKAEMEQTTAEREQSAQQEADQLKACVQQQTEVMRSLVELLAHLSGDRELFHRPLSDFQRAVERESKKQQKTLLADARRDVDQNIGSYVRELENAVELLEGWSAIADGDYENGRRLLEQSGEANRWTLAQIDLQAGKVDEAIESARRELESHENEVLPGAHLIHLLWQAGKHDEAAEALESLRSNSDAIDLTAPVFARLAPVAEHLQLPADWRIARELPTDLGARPPLDSLGPVAWQPAAAPDWSLPDAHLQSHSLKQFTGKPVLVVFYLGHGCLHCVEQIKALVPKSSEFAELGIQMVAISTDPTDELLLSIENYNAEEMPIQLLSNASLDVFKAYRAFDDFENQPLHGTFLIDGDGQIRWQDIGFEPFMEIDFLLAESRRLLALSQDSVAATAVDAEAISAADPNADGSAGQVP